MGNRVSYITPVIFSVIGMLISIFSFSVVYINISDAIINILPGARDGFVYVSILFSILGAIGITLMHAGYKLAKGKKNV